MRYLAAALAATALLVCTSCAWFGDKQKERPAKELVQEGIEAFDKGNYSEALGHFEQLKDWYPFSKYAILAELKIGDANYHLEQYAEAIEAYEEFEQLHPLNEAIPYVIYQIGRSYYEQTDSIDRDQLAAERAVATFQRLAQSHPDSPYTRQSQSHIINCYKKLAGHEFYVAMFYYKDKRFEAALQRFKKVVTKYPDVGIHHQAMQYIAKCEALLATNNSTKN